MFGLSRLFARGERPRTSRPGFRPQLERLIKNLQANG